MKNYISLLADVLHNGEERSDRTGVGTLSTFGKTLTFDLRKGFPAVTTKKLHFKSVAAELAGFLEGTRSAARMRELGTKIWDANANAISWQNSGFAEGPDDMGYVYGSLWRNFNGVDQLINLVNTIINNPTDRRQVVSAWNPAEPRQCLPPCHIFWQTYCTKDNELDLLFYMRSVDLFLGLPFDIASYALLQHIIAQQVDYIPRYLTVLMGDTHIYLNHVDQVKLQISRTPFTLPHLSLSDEASIDTFHPSMAELINYRYHPQIKAPMAI